MPTDAQRAYWREYNRRRREAARAEDVCIVCTIRDARPGKVSCMECALRKCRRQAGRGKPQPSAGGAVAGSGDSLT